MKAILTGHTRGIGEAVAAELLARNIPLFALARSENPLLASRYPGLLRQAALDLADPRAIAAWLGGEDFRQFVADAATLLLINNAGTLGPVAPPGRQDADALVRAVNLNITTPLLLADAVARNCPGELRIAHVSSGAGRNAYPGWSIYGATKAALDHHARIVQSEKPVRLRICSIAPGVVDTEMQAEIRQSSSDDFPLHEQFVQLKAQQKLSPPAAVARQFASYLLSDEFGDEAVVDLRQLRPA